MKCPACGASLPSAHVFEWLTRSVSALCLAIGFIVLIVSLAIMMSDPARLFLLSTDVTAAEVQTEISRKGAILEEEIEALRGSFKTFDDDRWNGARSLFASWVNEYGVSREEKLEFLSGLKRIAETFAPEQRAAALDAYHRLKLDKMLKAGRGAELWVTQIRSISTIFWALLLIGVFSIALLLAELVKTNRIIGGK